MSATLAGQVVSSIATTTAAAAEVAFVEASRRYESASGAAFDSYHHLVNACRWAGEDGLWCEFGVSTGGSLWQISDESSEIVWGFDCFGGLPEDWERGEGDRVAAGSYAGYPTALRLNSRLVEGYFADTVAPFLTEHDRSLAFAHIDCDLYSAAACVLKAVAPRVVAGTVLVFDELYNYQYYWQNEMRALLEVASAAQWSYQYLGHVPATGAASLIVTAVGGSNV